MMRPNRNLKMDPKKREETTNRKLVRQKYLTVWRDRERISRGKNAYKYINSQTRQTHSFLMRCLFSDWLTDSVKLSDQVKSP